MGTYAVKYVTSSSICADSTTFNVTLTATNTVSVNGAYDISTATFVQNFSVVTQDLTPREYHLTMMEPRCMSLEMQVMILNEYNLSTAFDVSTAYVMFRKILCNNAWETGTSMTFNNDGTKMFIILTII